MRTSTFASSKIIFPLLLCNYIGYLVGSMTGTKMLLPVVQNNCEVGRKNNNNNYDNNNKNGGIQLVENIGQLGPSGSSRANLNYYDSLYFLALQYGTRKARNVLEVGCSVDPFIQHLTWIPNKQCVAPYFATFQKKKKENNNTKKKKKKPVEYDDNENITMAMTTRRTSQEEEEEKEEDRNNDKNKNVVHGVELIQADFMKWQRSRPQEQQYLYDLTICSQVVEHVPDPQQFVQRLLQTAKIVIISVPYLWPSGTGHVTDMIDVGLLYRWSYPTLPISTTIVTDEPSSSSSSSFADNNNNHDYHQRLIVVYQQHQEDQSSLDNKN